VGTARTSSWLCRAEKTFIGITLTPRPAAAWLRGDESSVRVTSFFFQFGSIS